MLKQDGTQHMICFGEHMTKERYKLFYFILFYFILFYFILFYFILFYLTKILLKAIDKVTAINEDLAKYKLTAREWKIVKTTKNILEVIYLINTISK
jgi:hypothetical protein